MRLVFNLVLAILTISSVSFAGNLVDCSTIEAGYAYSASVTQDGSQVEVQIAKISNVMATRSFVGQNSLGPNGKYQYPQISRSQFKNLLNTKNSSIDANDTLHVTYQRSDCAINPINSKIIRCMVPNEGVNFLSEVKTKQSVSIDEHSNSSATLEISLSINPKKENTENIVWMESPLKFLLDFSDDTGHKFSNLIQCKM